MDPLTFTEADVKEPSLLLRLLRKIKDRIMQVSDRVGRIEAAKPPPSSDQIRADLQATGIAPLNVNGLLGVLAQAQIAAAQKFDTVPSGQVLQGLKDTQLILVTNGTGFDLYSVVGGNPTTLSKLVTGAGGAGGGSFVTTDTVQTITGVKTFGVDATATDININGPAGVGRLIRFLTASVGRWILRTNATAEGGANAGSDFEFRSFTDAGVLIATPITITRSNGNVALSSKITTYNSVSQPGWSPPVVAVAQPAADRTTALGATTVFTTVTAGIYRLTSEIQVTTNSVGGTISLDITHTDLTGAVLNNNVIDSVSGSGVGADVTINGRLHSTVGFYCAAGTAIQVGTTFNAVVGTPHYYLDAVVEQLS